MGQTGSTLAPDEPEFIYNEPETNSRSKPTPGRCFAAQSHSLRIFSLCSVIVLVLLSIHPPSPAPLVLPGLDSAWLSHHTQYGTVVAAQCLPPAFSPLLYFRHPVVAIRASPAGRRFLTYVKYNICPV